MSRGSFSSWLVDQQDQEAGLIDEDTPDWERAQAQRVWNVSARPILINSTLENLGEAAM